MDFTEYSQLLSYLPASTDKLLDIIGQDLASSAENIIDLREAESHELPSDEQFDAILCRFALSLQADPYRYLNDILPMLREQGYLVIQDIALYDDERVTDYLNGFLHIFDSKHVQAFAQYAWDGLLLDVGVNTQSYYRRSIQVTIQAFIDLYQPDDYVQQRAQVLLVQAPSAVKDAIGLRYEGTSFAEFEIQEIVYVVQKEA